MSLIGFIIVVVLVGAILWAVNKYIPMDETVRKILNVVVIIALVIWILSVFGILPDLNAIRVGN